MKKIVSGFDAHYVTFNKLMHLITTNIRQVLRQRLISSHNVLINCIMHLHIFSILVKCTKPGVFMFGTFLLQQFSCFQYRSFIKYVSGIVCFHSCDRSGDRLSPRTPKHEKPKFHYLEHIETRNLVCTKRKTTFQS